MQDGLRGDPSLLIMKSALDFFAGMSFAAAMGMGVAFAGVIVLLFQGGLTLGASALSGILSEAMVADMTAAGGVILVGLGLILLDVRRVKAANLLPALVTAPRPHSPCGVPVKHRLFTGSKANNPEVTMKVLVHAAVLTILAMSVSCGDDDPFNPARTTIPATTPWRLATPGITAGSDPSTLTPLATPSPEPPP
jgi:hypothetical protein